MKPTVQSRKSQTRLSPTTGSTARCAPDAAPRAAWHGAYVNALEHGLPSGSVLVPGDDAAAFRTLRHRLFHLYQPRTIAEAQHVETLAANQWRVARCRLEQTFFKVHLGAAMSGHPDATGYLCDPDLHRLHHRGTDCRREERSLEKSMSEAEAALTRIQRQRTQNLTPGRAASLEDYRVFLAEGEPRVAGGAQGVVEEPVSDDAEREAPGEEPSVEKTEGFATGSADRGNSIGPKRTPGAPSPDFPKHWNRRQRRKAALRREAALRRRGLG